MISIENPSPVLREIDLRRAAREVVCSPSPILPTWLEPAVVDDFRDGAGARGLRRECDLRSRLRRPGSSGRRATAQRGAREKQPPENAKPVTAGGPRDPHA